MSETAHHILTAERHLTQLQEQQLRWAETSPEAADALHKARTRAVLHVAARMNATGEQLHQLRQIMCDKWTVAGERAGGVVDAAYAWADDVNEGEDDDWEVLALVHLLEELWPDVVAQTDAWARGVSGDAK
ncbi:hypothetical protein [Mycobacterium avium]|uniref:hypothetical protein n=1 Tax=Mycobacterium avium TaxID=1764 RepID=UPI0007A0AF5C|nr:hypothetical protein [Mycobacterium avium]